VHTVGLHNLNKHSTVLPAMLL